MSPQPTRRETWRINLTAIGDGVQSNSEGTRGRQDHLSAIEAVALEDARHRVRRVLEVAREVLEMEVSYYSEVTATEQVVLGVDGDPAAFGFSEGTRVPMRATFCRRMLDGQIPNRITDVSEHGAVRNLPGVETSGVRSYIGVPVELSDGRIFGTFCCASHSARTDLDQRDERFMRVLARLLGEELERGAQAAGFAETADADAEAVARLSLWFAGAPKAAPAARQALRSLGDHIGDDTLHQMNLLVTELVTNAVRHAGLGPSATVGLDVVVMPDSVRAEVSDPGPGFEPTVTNVEAMDEGGRGLMLVDLMSRAWGVRNENGSRVWFELERVPAA